MEACGASINDLRSIPVDTPVRYYTLYPMPRLPHGQLDLFNSALNCARSTGTRYTWCGKEAPDDGSTDLYGEAGPSERRFTIVLE